MSSGVGVAALPKGLRLVYTDQGDGTPVVLLHGYSDSHRSFDLLLPLLPRSWRVVAVTQRGHGASDKPAHGYAIADLAADVADLLDALGLERAVLVGHSMGAAVALQAAADYPERVAGLVLLGAFADFRSNAGVIELVEAVAHLGDPVDAGFARAFQESTVTHPLPGDFMDMVVRESLALPLHVWRGIAEGLMSADIAGAMRCCQAPALIVWGEEDGLCPAADQLQLRDALPVGRLVRIPGAAHAVHWEEPKRVAGALVAFVASLEEDARTAAYA